MSPNVGNFVHDLVEMAKAMETLPQVQQELEIANSAIEAYAKQVQDREIAIIAYKQEIDDLHAKVRSLEVERDDASFRVLEAEDTAASVLNSARVAKAGLDIMIAKLDPPKPEPVKELEPQDSSEVNPTILGTVASSSSQDQTSVSNTVTQSESASTSTTIPEAVSSISELPGQSESSPTSLNISQEVSRSETEGLSNAIPEDGSVKLSAEPTHGPYFGKRYRDVIGYVSYQDWINGGGTEGDYGGRGW